MADLSVADLIRPTASGWRLRMLCSFGWDSAGTSHHSYPVSLTHSRLTSAQPLHPWRCNPAVALLGSIESGGVISVGLGRSQPRASGGRWNEQGAIRVVRLTD